MVIVLLQIDERIMTRFLGIIGIEMRINWGNKKYKKKRFCEHN